MPTIRNTVWGAFAIVLFCVFFSGCSNKKHADISVEDKGDGVHHEMKNNLAQPQELGCIALEEARSSYPPPDLYKGFAQCIAQKDFSKAVQLFLLAGIYSRFDEERIVDPSSGPGRQALIVQATSALTDEEREGFRLALEQLMGDSLALKNVCSQLVTIGYPAYFPQYLLPHQTDTAVAEEPSADALIPAFDSQSAWERLLDSYAHCPEE